jgi:hypothetical protein
MGIVACGATGCLGVEVAGWAETANATAARVAAKKGEIHRDMSISFHD